MKLYLISCFCILLNYGHVISSSHGNNNHCHRRILRRCASAISNFHIPMVESNHVKDTEQPLKTISRFCRNVQPSLRCVYSHLSACRRHVNTEAVEDRVGVLAYVCGEGRKDWTSGSSCWHDNNISARLRHCKERYNVDGIGVAAREGNVTDKTKFCSALDDYVWKCVGDWTIKRCPYNMAAFIMRVVNPERLADILRC